MDPNEVPTIAATPAALEGPPVSQASLGSAPSSSRLLPSSTRTQSASVVMQSEEEARARAFFRLAASLAIIGAAFMPFVAGPPLWRFFAVACCALASGVCVYALRALGKPGGYSPRVVTITGVAVGALAELALFYFGLFSAASMVLLIGVYFFGLSESARAAKITYVTGAVLFFTLGAGVVFGALPDLGPMPIGGLGVGWRWFFLVMTQVAFAMTFFLARSSRRATAIAIERVRRANFRIDQREAQLIEARGDLDRALRPGEGRYSGSSVGGYSLGEIVGRGGMGEVYRGAREDGGVAAVKLLYPNILVDPVNIERFMREAEIAQRVSSPYVTRVLSSGLTPAGLPFVAMELLTGNDLAWHLRKEPHMRLPKVAELVAQSARALVAIREAGIVHRDLKPHNFFLTSAPTQVWKVLDFGVSRLDAAGTITQGALVGTPSYMAPEQVRLERVDHRADIYSLAMVVYRTITGKPAFVGDDLGGLLYNVVHMPAPRPRGARQIPGDVELVLALGMAKDREDRFQKVEDFAGAFELAVRGELDAATRERARALLVKQPWAATAKPSAA
jgi:eukaryotic-like serine/threonine-protein kinase